eukprot:4005830-Amphidinium_carterae.1
MQEKAQDKARSCTKSPPHLQKSPRGKMHIARRCAELTSMFHELISLSISSAPGRTHSHDAMLTDLIVGENNRVPTIARRCLARLFIDTSQFDEVWQLAQCEASEMDALRAKRAMEAYKVRTSFTYTLRWEVGARGALEPFLVSSLQKRTFRICQEALLVVCVLVSACVGWEGGKTEPHRVDAAYHSCMYKGTTALSGRAVALGRLQS